MPERPGHLFLTSGMLIGSPPPALGVSVLTNLYVSLCGSNSHSNPVFTSISLPLLFSISLHISIASSCISLYLLSSCDVRHMRVHPYEAVPMAPESECLSKPMVLRPCLVVMKEVDTPTHPRPTIKTSAS